MSARTGAGERCAHAFGLAFLIAVFGCSAVSIAQFAIRVWAHAPMLVIGPVVSFVCLFVVLFLLIGEPDAKRGGR